MLPTEEFNLMQYSDKRTIEVQIPNGPLLRCPNSWDFKKNFTETSFKTLAKPDVENTLLKVEEIDLKPAFSKPIWKVTVLRQPESNLKNGTKFKNHM